jgi:hypothetical protein
MESDNFKYLLLLIVVIIRAIQEVVTSTAGTRKLALSLSVYNNCY